VTSKNDFALHPVDLATVSPYITHTIRRFGDWHLDLTPPEADTPTHLALSGMSG
jgi:hypothetical protein